MSFTDKFGFNNTTVSVVSDPLCIELTFSAGRVAYYYRKSNWEPCKKEVS